jgi:hypothetical protein
MALAVRRHGSNYSHGVTWLTELQALLDDKDFR